MLVSERLTIGQITFILRAAIQILTYGGLFLITYIILSSSPHVASLRTHDTVNRILGKSTATKSAALWIVEAVRGRNTDPVLPRRLLLAIFLSLLLGIFSSISDLGFLGFYACSVAGPSTSDKPSSITSQDLAVTAINASMVNGTDPAAVMAYRCDYAEEVQFNVNVTERVCRSWHNSTFADPTFFSGLNMTDSDNLIPRQLRKYAYKRSQYLGLNSYFIGPNIKRIEEPTISNGIMVVPHDMGFKAVFGVPQLKPQSKVSFDGAMALEVEMGCMALGMYTQHDLDNTGGSGIDIFATNSSWRKYYGPDNLYDILSTTVDDVRSYYRPLFNESSIDSSGFLVGTNSTSAILSTIASIHEIPFSSVAGQDGALQGNAIMGNCTQAIRQKFGIELIDASSMQAPDTCSVLAIGGSTTSEGYLYEGLSRMVCATTTQLNLVSTTIEANPEGQVNFTKFDRLPSDLNYIRANFFDAVPQDNGDTIWYDYDPVERYTLNPNPSSPSEHYLLQRPFYSNIRGIGAGSGGGILARAGTAMLDLNGAYDNNADYAGITVLSEGTRQIFFNASMITKWGGEVGASFILESSAFNGWAAYESAPIEVESTGGRVATCYKGPYVLGFVPLLIASLIVFGWMLFILVAGGGISSIKYGKQLENLYGGMAPFWGVVCPTTRAQDAYLFWENTPPAGPHLALVTNGIPNDSEEREQTAVEFLARQDGMKR
ncbi:hypothetical protein VNI00_011235 [Paramarasmius palmivorus]|uniref:Uncharacterized protein n=1 Tax=Paramarasmius palmivorus TaxID=297713 RepID=A0AAW0CHX7_9AGAR